MGKKILIADDSISVRKMLSMTLSEAGYLVIEAIDGVDALDKAITQQPDIIITDLNMPNLDGIQLIARLRALPAFQNIPILMLTTESQDIRKQEGRKAGATGWIVKPFRPDQLLNVLKKLIN